MVDIKPDSETDEKLNEPTADVKGQIKAELKEKGVEFDTNESLPPNALWGWEVVRWNNDTYWEIRKTLNIKGHDVEIQMSPVEHNDVKKATAEREMVSSELIKTKLPGDVIRNITKYVAGKRRTRKGKKSRKMRKTRGRKH